MRRLLKRGVLVGILAGAGYAIYKALAARRPDTGGLTFEAQPFPSPPRPVPKVSTPATPSTPAPSLAPKTEPNSAAKTTPKTTPKTAPKAKPKAKPKTATKSAPWLDANDGACPVSHPVKAKLASGIFHVPGGQSYERTKADRCYVDAPAAEADGLRPAKR